MRSEEGKKSPREAKGGVIYRAIWLNRRPAGTEIGREGTSRVAYAPNIGLNVKLSNRKIPTTASYRV